MKCPYCDSWSDVLQTRDSAAGGLRRRRRCANGHRFSTTEQPNRALVDRDRQIVAAVTAGRTMTEVAREFGLKTHSEVSRVVQRLSPLYPARSAGQVARWAKQRGAA
jgi:transcriptional regulator NrdR family protein